MGHSEYLRNCLEKIGNKRSVLDFGVAREVSRV